MEKLRLGVLVSGRGTNLQAVLDAIEDAELQAEVAIVISNHAGVPALARAARHGVPFAVVERGGFRSRDAHQRAIGDLLSSRGVQLIVLAGFDRILGAEFVSRFAQSIINVHPSLLPAFGGGLHAQADALAYGVKIAGCTVHLVTSEVDAGPILVQRAVAVHDDDTAGSLAERILAQEHRALPEAIRLFATGRLVVEGRRVRLG